MSVDRQWFYLPILCTLISSTSVADEFSLQGLRFFFTPDQRKPEVTVKPIAVETQPKVRQKRDLPTSALLSIRYIGEIRSQTKQRLFWRQGSDRYLSTASTTEGSGHNNGNANTQGKSNSAERKD